jgi:hypothetical protein
MKPPLRSGRISTQPYEPIRFSFAVLLCLAVFIQPLNSQSLPSQPASPQTTNPQEKPMKHYALVFHTNSNRTLTPKEQEQRQVEIAAWAKQVTDMGIKLDPRALGETAANFSVEGDKIVSHEGSIDPAFRNLVFFDSASRDQAINIARIHPGLRYGSTVEVREWTDPRQGAAKP